MSEQLERLDRLLDLTKRSMELRMRIDTMILALEIEQGKTRGTGQTATQYREQAEKTEVIRALLSEYQQVIGELVAAGVVAQTGRAA